ncbi:MAG: hypothetical protein AAF438_14810 [Pseudomonadota bacterium]
MSNRANTRQDAFSFSLRGLTTMSAFTLPPIVAGDLLNKRYDERMKQIKASNGSDPHNTVSLNLWRKPFRRMRRAA